MHGLLPVGDVVRPHGIRGELVIDSAGDSIAMLQAGDAVWLGVPPVRYVVRAIRPHQGRLLVAVDGVHDRNQAEALRGATVWLQPAQRAELAAGEMWVEDLAGARLLDADGREIGRVEGILEAPAQDLLEVRTPAGEVLVPMVREWLRGWDAERRELRMQLPAGLLPTPRD